jgi:hypothetical protein
VIRTVIKRAATAGHSALPPCEFGGGIRALHQRIDADDYRDLIEAKRLLAPLQGHWRRHPKR